MGASNGSKQRGPWSRAASSLGLLNAARNMEAMARKGMLPAVLRGERGAEATPAPAVRERGGSYIVITWPSGSSYDFSRADDWVAVCISWSKSRATNASFSLMSRTISRSAVVVKE